ncbi:MAG: ATP-grasp domain-containing protein, partial [Planctomycetota bacterium]
MSVRTIGVLGAGQLGRLLALAGYPLGLRFEFLSDRPDDCAAHVAPHTVASYEHAEAVAAFARRCDVVTYEFENVPIAAAEAVLATGVPLRPNESILETAQDRVREKSALAAARIEVSAPRPVIEAEDARRAFEELGRRVVFKTRRDGYDGKGQRVVSSADEAARAYDELGGVELNAEPFVEFDRELSSIAVRGADGDVRFYPLTENHHERGILRRSISPAPN